MRRGRRNGDVGVAGGRRTCGQGGCGARRPAGQGVAAGRAEGRARGIRPWSARPVSPSRLPSHTDDEAPALSWREKATRDQSGGERTWLTAQAPAVPLV